MGMAEMRTLKECVECVGRPAPLPGRVGNLMQTGGCAPGRGVDYLSD
jgi:hypothetical protein